MNTLKLNSISNSIFSCEKNDRNTIKVNGRAALNREEIISAGRLALVEYLGREGNRNSLNTERYNSKVKNYAGFQKSVMEDTLLYCSALANATIGKEAYKTIDEVKADRSLYGNQVFLRALADISEAVITPLYPEVVPAGLDRLVNFDRVGLGETKLIDIESNDFFLFDDDSWGSVSSKPYQYLYKAQIALTAKPYTAKAKILWYRDVIGGEAGKYYAALMRGAYNKIYASVVDSFKKAIANTKYLPASLVYDSFSQDNWNHAVMTASALNGVSRNQLTAIGTLAALSNVFPTIGTSGVIAGAQSKTGDEWVSNGFLANVSGVDLVEVGLAVVPHTQNYQPQFISLDDATSENIYILPRIGRAPIEGVIADGSPISITFTPRETADMSIDISETIVYDVKPAFSQKLVKISV